MGGWAANTAAFRPGPGPGATDLIPAPGPDGWRMRLTKHQPEVWSTSRKTKQSTSTQVIHHNATSSFSYIITLLDD